MPRSFVARWRRLERECEDRQVTATLDEAGFARLAEEHRRELQLHCYRILGSVQDAEDVVQEALLAAWRGRDGFEGRASPRSWLYAIATNRCLNHVRTRGRRPREVAPTPADAPPPTRLAEPVWLEPYPDVLLPDASRATQPEARYESREAIALAFVSGLQRLPTRQRAALVLRDVLGFRAGEVAAMLGATEIAVNRLVDRARRGLEAIAPAREDAPLPESPEERALVARFTAAFEAGDVGGVIALLTEDALLTMPPTPLAYVGRAAIRGFLSSVPAGGELECFRLVPTRANGQPAFACYLRDQHSAVAHAYGLMVLTVGPEGVEAITGFPDTSLFRPFGLPRTLQG
jgi:RNA polymerase sigma-70 factor (TIGR02960 family)